MPQHESNAVPPREMLEPCALRGASTVLRGGRCSDTPSLPDPQDYNLVSFQKPPA
jgi:hypothetical protein